MPAYSNGPLLVPATAAPPANEGTGARPRRPSGLGSAGLVLMLAVLYFVLLLPVAPDLANIENLKLILSNMLPLLAVTLGQTFVLITKGIDLSVTAIIAAASVAGAAVMALPGWTGAAALLVGALVMVGLGAAVGLINGLAVTKLTMPPFMVTLSTMMALSGAAVFGTRGTGIYGLPAVLAVLSQEELGGVPCAALLVVPLGVFAHVLLFRTLLGRWLFAVGRNPKTARVSGVPVHRTIVLAYVLCGGFTAVGALLYTGRLETGSPVLGQRIFLDVVGAAVMGGVSLFGGKGSVAGVLCGVLFITLIDNSLDILGFSSFAVLMTKGVVILMAAVLDATRARRVAA